MDIQMHKTKEGRPGIYVPDLTSKENGLISVFESHEEADFAVKQMQKAGFDMKKISIIGRDFQTEENIVGFYNIGDRTKQWGKMGAFWGGVWGLLFGSALFVIPGVAPTVVAGAVEGAVIVGGLSALGAALFSLGIPKDSVIVYETAVQAGKYLMIAHGTSLDIARAKEIVTAHRMNEPDDFELTEKLLKH